MSSLMLRSRRRNELHLSVYQTGLPGSALTAEMGGATGARSIGEASRRLHVDPEEVKLLLQQQLMPYDLADAIIRQLDGDAIRHLNDEEVGLLGELHLVERPAGSDAHPTPSVDEMPKASTPDPAPVSPIPSVVGGNCSVDHLADEPAATADVALPRNETSISNITDEDYSRVMSDVLDEDAAMPKLREVVLDDDSTVSDRETRCLGTLDIGSVCSLEAPPLRARGKKKWRQRVKALNHRLRNLSLSRRAPTVQVVLPEELIRQCMRPRTGTKYKPAAETSEEAKNERSDNESKHSSNSEDEQGRRSGSGGIGPPGPPDGDDDGSDPSSSDDDLEQMDERSWGHGSEEDTDSEDEGRKKYSTGGFTLKSQLSKGMCRGFRGFCHMRPKDACRLTAKFRILDIKDLAAYHKRDWESTFKVWGEKQKDARGKTFRIFFTPIQQERIKVFAWICHYWERLGWPLKEPTLPPRFDRPFHPAMLRDRHYDEAKAQMEREKSASITSEKAENEEFAGLETWDTIKKQDIGVLHRSVITWCNEHYDGDTGMCLGWVVRDNIYAPEWVDKLSYQAAQRNARPNFFNFAATDELTIQMAPIVPRENGNASCREAVYRERYETGERRLFRTPQFMAADAIVYRAAKYAFKGSQCEVHFHTSNKMAPSMFGTMQKVPPSGRAVLNLIKGQYMGKAAAKMQVERVLEDLRSMKYHGESRNWNLNKHIYKAMEIQRTHDFYAPSADVPLLSDYDLITEFLKSIPKDCTNTSLLTRKHVIEGEREKYASFAADVVPYLSGCVSSNSRDDTKRRIASTNTQREPKRSRPNGGRGGGGGSQGGRGGGGNRSGWGSLKLANGKVVGTIEGKHYAADCWSKMSAEQKAECMRLRKDKKERTAAAVSTETEKLKREVKSLTSQLREMSRDRRSSSRRRSRSASTDSGRRSSRSSRRRGGSGRDPHSGRRPG